MQLSIEQIRELAELERQMDSGQQPFVVVGRDRAPVDKSIMQHFGLASGQTVSDALLMEIMRAEIARLTRIRDEEEAKGE